MYAENPAYFDAPQTTYGVRRIGPMHQNPHCANPARYQPMGTLSIDGKIIPAPIHSALSGVHLGSANGEEGGEWKSYALYAGGGIIAGGALYFLAKKLGWV